MCFDNDAPGLPGRAVVVETCGHAPRIPSWPDPSSAGTVGARPMYVHMKVVSKWPFWMLSESVVLHRRLLHCSAEPSSAFEALSCRHLASLGQPILQSSFRW